MVDMILVDPTVGMVLDYMDEIVYRTVQLADHTIPFSTVRLAVKRHEAASGRPVSEAVAVYPIMIAYRDMIRRCDHRLSDTDIAWYGMRLALTSPIVLRSWTPFQILAALWPFDKRLAAICCNHQLVYRHEDAFAPFLTMVPRLERIIREHDEQSFDYEFIQRVPRMVSDKEEKDAFGQ